MLSVVVFTYSNHWASKGLKNTITLTIDGLQCPYKLMPTLMKTLGSKIFSVFCTPDIVHHRTNLSSEVSLINMDMLNLQPRLDPDYDLLTPPSRSFKPHSGRPHSSSHNLPMKGPSPALSLSVSLVSSLTCRSSHF